MDRHRLLIENMLQHPDNQLHVYELQLAERMVLIRTEGSPCCTVAFAEDVRVTLGGSLFLLTLFDGGEVTNIVTMPLAGSQVIDKYPSVAGEFPRREYKCGAFSVELVLEEIVGGDCGNGTSETEQGEGPAEDPHRGAGEG